MSSITIFQTRHKFNLPSWNECASALMLMFSVHLASTAPLSIPGKGIPYLWLSLSFLLFHKIVLSFSDLWGCKDIGCHNFVACKAFWGNNVCHFWLSFVYLMQTMFQLWSYQTTLSKGPQTAYLQSTPHRLPRGTQLNAQSARADSKNSP